MIHDLCIDREASCRMVERQIREASEQLRVGCAKLILRHARSKRISVREALNQLLYAGELA